MNRKRFKAEEIVNKLREVDVHLSEGQTVAQACKQIGVTGLTYYITDIVQGLDALRGLPTLFAHAVLGCPADLCEHQSLSHNRCDRRARMANCTNAERNTGSGAAQLRTRRPSKSLLRLPACSMAVGFPLVDGS